jgi:cytosine/adenosine deaminase-related metal-dependent hydrolase
MGLVAWLDEIGLLNERLTVAHAVWLEDEDIALLAKRGVSVSVNVSSNLRLRSGSPRIAALFAAGVRVAIGLDGMALDDDEDMLREMRLSWHTGARIGALGKGLEPARLLGSAIEGGRHAVLGRDRGGRIEVGAPADLLELDLAALVTDCLHPDPDLAALVLGRGQSRHVRRVIAKGRIISDGGRCAGIDLPALEAQLIAQGRAAYMHTREEEGAIAEMQQALHEYYKCSCSH